MKIMNKTGLFGILLLLLVLVRVPFYVTHHIQEDAYISLRCAESLAATGVYGFNPGERTSASTSHLYVFIATLIRLAAGEKLFIPGVQLMNTICFLLGAYFITRSLNGRQKNPYLLWIIISLLPVSMMISYSGMETSLLLFVIGIVLYELRYKKHPWLAWIGIGLMPWIRPDAVAYAVALIVWNSIQQKKIQWIPIFSLIVGSGSLLLFNKFYFGPFLNQSIIAKNLSRPEFSLDRFLINLRLVFAENVGGIFNPIRTKYTDPLGYFFLLLFIAIIWLFIWQNRKDKVNLYTSLMIGTMIFVIPVAYAAGGVVFPWYMWPSTFLAYAVLVAFLINWIDKHWAKIRLGYLVLGIGILGLLIMQWGYSYNWGTKERSFRGGIGEFLRSRAKSSDSLFLEPAGYIPFYSKLYTFDEVGIVNPLVVRYRKANPTGWWIDFVMDVKPDWVVQRSHFLEHRTYQGYQLSTKEWSWFEANYELIEKFNYFPEDYTTSKMLISLLRLGDADDYFVYRKKLPIFTFH